jgi:hypothetical protein
MYSLVQCSLKIHFKTVHSFTTNFTSSILSKAIHSQLENDHYVGLIKIGFQAFVWGSKLHTPTFVDWVELVRNWTPHTAGPPI